MKKLNQVDCLWCKEWEEAWHLLPEPHEVRDCRRCNNTKKIDDPREVLCNLCGECMCPLGTYNEQVPHGLYNAKVTGGYDSYHLLDMSQYTFSFCEKCLRQLFIQCKIKPEIHDMNFDLNFNPTIAYQEYSWEDDQKSYEYNVWRDNGGHHQAYLNRKCNSIKDCPNDAIYTLLHNDIDFTENSFCEEHKNRKYGNSTLVKFISNTLKPFL